MPINRFVIKFPLGLALCLVATLSVSSSAQQKAPLNPSSSCNQKNALEILEEQIAATKTFDDQVQRITVSLQAADLLWPLQQHMARALLLDTFELANRDFKEKGDKPVREGIGLSTDLPDQRYIVIRAIAKRDPSWARKLTNQLLEDQQSETQENNSKTVQQEPRTAERLLNVANELLASNQAAALSFARSSLRYPATFYLSIFLYNLAELNRTAAEQLYLEALTAYANAPMDRLLYLSSYPFGNNREAGEMPDYAIYSVPNGFVPNPNLQRSFVQMLLRRVQQRLAHPVETSPHNAVSDTGQMWLALSRLEKQIQDTLPDLAAQVEQAKGSLFGLLSPSSQRLLGQTISEQMEPVRSFNDQVELAEKNPNVDRRDQQLVFAVIGASGNEDLDLVLRVVDKISDSALRPQLLNWLYFSRTQNAIREKQLLQARKLAAKVDELDQRAYLYFQIAEESLKQDMDQAEAREMLEEVVDSTAKAPATMVTARTQLGVAYLYTRIDLNRAIAVLGDAVRIINRIEQPDFSRQFVIRQINGKTFGSYATFQTPGFNPENAFGELAKADFDGTLYQASNLTNKPLRARTTLALIEPCLKPPQRVKSTKKPNN